MTTRRTFVTGLGAAGLAASTSALFAAPKRRTRLAFQVYGVRDLCARDYLGTLKTVRALGYEGVGTGRFYGLDGKGLRTLCTEAGLALVALRLYPASLVEPELAKTIRICRDAGTDRINVAWFKGSAENPNDWQLLVNDALRRRHPENVAKIYLDAPLLNFDGFKSDIGPWAAKRPANGNWTNDPEMPVNLAGKVAAAKIPLLLLYGGEDQTVPPKQNGELFLERFKAAGGEIEVERRDGFGQHPHGLDPNKTDRIVSFFDVNENERRTK